MHRRSAVVGLGAVLCLAAPAYGDSSSRAAAQVLFDQARRLMSEGKYPPACAKLQESQRLEPGGGTILLLARCHVKEGKTATAWTDYQDALRVAIRDKRSERERLAREEGAALEARLSRLVITVPATAVVPGFVVARDGEPVSSEQWTVPIPVDPGRHEVGVSATGRKPWSTAVEVRGEGATVTVAVPVLQAGPEPERRVATESVPLVGAPEASPPPSDQAARPGSAHRIGAVVAGAVGLGFVAAGSVYGLKAKATYQRSREEGCANGVCSTTGGQIQSDGFAQARTATLFFGLGAAALVAGLTLWLTAPQRSEPAVALHVAPSELVLRGSW